MANVNPYLDILQMRQPAQDFRAPIVDALKEFSDGIETFKQGRITCKVVRGYPTNLGQEYRIVMTSVRTGYDHTLLRAYVPLMGKDVQLDLYGGKLEICPDIADLKTALKAFVALDETRRAIEEYSR